MSSTLPPWTNCRVQFHCTWQISDIQCQHRRSSSTLGKQARFLEIPIRLNSLASAWSVILVVRVVAASGSSARIPYWRSAVLSYRGMLIVFRAYNSATVQLTLFCFTIFNHSTSTLMSCIHLGQYASSDYIYTQKGPIIGLRHQCSRQT
jgi:hypothetical protein